MCGKDVRNYILENGVRLWQVADKLGICDCYFSKKLRKTFTEEEFARVKDIVANIKNA